MDSKKLKEAKYYKKIEEKKVVCNVCYRNCVIENNKFGFCGTRKNIEGTLYTLVYGKPVAINIDPIEKKPIFNYLPHTKTLSFGTLGCNFDCMFCQNYDISKATETNIYLNKQFIEPQEIIELVKKYNCPSISYTYTEPTIFVEYALDIMKLAKKNNLKNIWVSNGYMQKKVLNDICKYLDAINVDLKGNQQFYDKLINGINVEKIKENIELFYKKGIHIEITNLLIEGYNTDKKQIQEIIEFIASISKDIPLHFTRSFGAYKLTNIQPTKPETIEMAREMAIKKGLKYVYIGNI